MKKNAYKETDLYEPIKRLLTERGFLVKGEVKGCDIAAVNGETLWVVEMKLSFNMTLLYQAMERLKLTEFVFVAVPRPRKTRDKNFLTAQRIIKKLELGLITVSLDSPLKMAEILIFPDGKRNKNNKATAIVKREIEGRTGDTAGGGAKRPVNTAYRERSVRIACLLEFFGPLDAKTLIKCGCERDAYSIMYANFHGWYKKNGRGTYALSERGKSYLNENAQSDLVAYYRMKAETLSNPVLE